MKQYIVISTFALSVIGLTTPAVACDMHGAGSFPGGFGAKWTPYNPTAYTDDFSDYTPKSDEERKAESKKKPSFSNFARLALRKAQDKAEAKTEKSDTEKSVKKEANLETDR